jgi:hypothetical protein
MGKSSFSREGHTGQIGASPEGIITYTADGVGNTLVLYGSRDNQISGRFGVAGHDHAYMVFGVGDVEIQSLTASDYSGEVISPRTDRYAGCA